MGFLLPESLPKGTEHPAPFMTITFNVAKEWRQRVPEVVHEDGDQEASPDGLISANVLQTLDNRLDRVSLGIHLGRRTSRQPCQCEQSDAGEGRDHNVAARGTQVVDESPAQEGAGDPRDDRREVLEQHGIHSACLADEVRKVGAARGPIERPGRPNEKGSDAEMPECELIRPQQPGDR